MLHMESVLLSPIWIRVDIFLISSRVLHKHKSGYITLLVGKSVIAAMRCTNLCRNSPWLWSYVFLLSVIV